MPWCPALPLLTEDDLGFVRIQAWVTVSITPRTRYFHTSREKFSLSGLIPVPLDGILAYRAVGIGPAINVVLLSSVSRIQQW